MRDSGCENKRGHEKLSHERTSVYSSMPPLTSWSSSMFDVCYCCFEMRSSHVRVQDVNVGTTAVVFGVGVGFLMMNLMTQAFIALEPHHSTSDVNWSVQCPRLKTSLSPRFEVCLWFTVPSHLVHSPTAKGGQLSLTCSKYLPSGLLANSSTSPPRSIQGNLSLSVMADDPSRDLEAGQCWPSRAESSGELCRRGNVFFSSARSSRRWAESVNCCSVARCKMHDNWRLSRQRSPRHIRFLSNILLVFGKSVLRMGVE